MTWLLSIFLKFASSGLVDKVLDYMDRKAEVAGDVEQARSKVRIEAIKAVAQETQVMANLQKAKFQFPWFWVFVGLFVVPLGIWWAAICLDSVFLFSWNVATIPLLENWGGQMIQWLFYVGSGVGAIKTLTK